MRLQHLVDLFQHFGDAQFGGLGQRGREITPKCVKHAFISARACTDLVKLVFQIGGKVELDIFAEVIDQECRYQSPLILGDQAVFLFAHIAARHDRIEDRGIGGWPPDAQFFHPFDQGRLGVAGGWLGEMLLAQHRAIARQKGGRIFGHARLGRGFAGELGPIIRQRARSGFERLAARHLRQAAAFFILGIVAAFLIDLEESVEQHDLARCAQLHLRVGAGDGHGGAFKPGGLHLAGDGAFPDQFVKLALVIFAQAQVAGGFLHIGGADTFMRLLRILGLVFVHARIGGDIFGAETRLDRVACRMDRLGGHVDAIGPHIGDMARLIEALGGTHGLARTHAVFAACLLLQGRGHEGRRGVAIGGPCLDIRDR